MKKTFNLSIGGALFHVEEDAYEKLESYISDIRAHFEGNPDKEEILKDIEARIAEKFSEKNGKIITLLDVNSIMETMGRVDQFDTNEGDDATHRENIKTTKRFYLDRENAILGGVSAGLGHYFGVDPLIFRLLFLVSIFFGGVGGVVYLVLMLLVPEAKTPSQKLSMRGTAVTISAMAEMIKEKIDQVNPEETKSFFKQLINIPLQAIRAVLRFLSDTIFPSIRVLLGSLILIVSFMFAVGATVAASFSLFAVSPTFIEGPVLAIAQSSLAHVLAVSLYLVVLIPLILIAILGINFITNRSHLRKLTGITLVIIWFAAIAVAGASGSKIAVRVTDTIRNDPFYKTVSQVQDVDSFTGLVITNNQSVRLVTGETYKVELRGRPQDIENMILTNATSTLAITEKEREHGPCIICRNDRVQVTITVPTLSSLTMTDSSYASGDVTGNNFSLSLDNNSSANLDIIARSLSISERDSSQASLTGSATTLTGDLANGSRLDAQNFEASNVTLKATNDSYAHLNVKTSLSITATNGSTVRYLGEAKVQKKEDPSSNIESDNHLE